MLNEYWPFSCQKNKVTKCLLFSEAMAKNKIGQRSSAKAQFAKICFCIKIQVNFTVYFSIFSALWALIFEGTYWWA